MRGQLEKGQVPSDVALAARAVDLYLCRTNVPHAGLIRVRALLASSLHEHKHQAGDGGCQWVGVELKESTPLPAAREMLCFP